MTVTSGFFNSKNSDRKYDAKQMAQIFDGIINDGVYGTIYKQFAVKPGTGMQVLVDTGRAWFRHVWVLNDSVLQVSISPSEVLTDRIDAVVIEIDHSEPIRKGQIKYIKGTPSASPSTPVMINTELVRQYPLAFVRVNRGVNSISVANITNRVGISPTDLVTGPLKFMSIDQIVAQWEAQWSIIKNTFNNDALDLLTAYRNYLSEAKLVWQTWMNDAKAQNTKHINDLDKEFRDWWATIKVALDGDVAMNIINRLEKLEKDYGSYSDFKNAIDISKFLQYQDNGMMVQHVGYTGENPNKNKRLTLEELIKVIDTRRYFDQNDTKTIPLNTYRYSLLKARLNKEFRGKDITNELSKFITFLDQANFNRNEDPYYLGDYFMINGIRWTIVHFGYTMGDNMVDNTYDLNAVLMPLNTFIETAPFDTNELLTGPHGFLGSSYADFLFNRWDTKQAYTDVTKFFSLSNDIYNTYVVPTTNFYSSGVVDVNQNNKGKYPINRPYAPHSRKMGPFHIPSVEQLFGYREPTAILLRNQYARYREQFALFKLAGPSLFNELPPNFYYATCDIGTPLYDVSANKYYQIYITFRPFEPMTISSTGTGSNYAILPYITVSGYKYKL